jgi:hypothetical protein
MPSFNSARRFLLWPRKMSNHSLTWAALSICPDRSTKVSSIFCAHVGNTIAVLIPEGSACCASLPDKARAHIHILLPCSVSMLSRRHGTRKQAVKLWIDSNVRCQISAKDKMFMGACSVLDAIKRLRQWLSVHGACIIYDTSKFSISDMYTKGFGKCDLTMLSHREPSSMYEIDFDIDTEPSEDEDTTERQGPSQIRKLFTYPPTNESVGDIDRAATNLP